LSVPLFPTLFHHSCCCFYSFLFLKFPCLKKHTDWLSHTFFVFFLILGHQEAQDSLRWGRKVGWWMDCPCPCPVCVFLSKPGVVWIIYQKLSNNNSGEWNELHTCRVLARDLFLSSLNLSSLLCNPVWDWVSLDFAL
jgi:hypothetical protein